MHVVLEEFGRDVHDAYSDSKTANLLARAIVRLSTAIGAINTPHSNEGIPQSQENT